MERLFREYIHTDNLENSAHTLINPETLIETSDHKVGGDRGPNLGLDGVLTEPEKRLDSQILLDPLEEQLDLPAGFVCLRNYEAGDLEVVCDEDQELSSLRIQVTDSAQIEREARFGSFAGQANGLIGSQASGLVDGVRLFNVVAHVCLGSGDKECRATGNAGQASEIHVGAVHDIEGACFENDPIKNSHVVNCSRCNRDKHGDRTPKIYHGVQLDGRLGCAKPRPGKQTQTQVDGRGIQRVDHLCDPDRVLVDRIQSACPLDQQLSHLEEHPPVAILVGIGQAGPADAPPNTHRVKQPFLRPKAGLDVAQALPKGQLREHHAQTLIPGRKAPALPRHRISRYTPAELLPVNQVGNLRKDKAATVHGLQSQQESDQ